MCVLAKSLRLRLKQARKCLFDAVHLLVQVSFPESGSFLLLSQKSSRQRQALRLIDVVILLRVKSKHVVRLGEILERLHEPAADSPLFRNSERNLSPKMGYISIEVMK
jgi:hypothetical protein